MKDIFALTLDESSGEERLPGFSAEFPYLHSRAFLNRYVVPWHWHPALELFYVESGAMAYAVPGGSVRLPAGAGGLVRGGVLHASHPLEENTVQHLHLFDASFLAGAPGGVIERRISPRSPIARIWSCCPSSPTIPPTRPFSRSCALPFRWPAMNSAMKCGCARRWRASGSISSRSCRPPRRARSFRPAGSSA